MTNKILLVGGGGREDAIARKVAESGAEIYSVMKNRNPSIEHHSREALVHDELDAEHIAHYAKEKGVDLAFIGPDPVLNTPLADTLAGMGIRVASPSRSAARIETSKEFMRDFVNRNSIPGNLEYIIIRSRDELVSAIKGSDRDYAVKPLGLTGGKGVRVMGVQLRTREEAIEYGDTVLGRDGALLLEEKITGEEFSLQVFSDGATICPFPVAQDYKRAYENDEGPNTGGMGSITDSNGGLPFIRDSVVAEARGILQKVVYHMKEEGNPFKGVLYGQFMQSGGHARIIEFNARFADPEGINVLTLLDDDLTDILYEIADGTLRSRMNFRRKASVLKYVVPPGYGSKPEPGELSISDDPLPDDFRIYYAAVSGTLGSVRMSSSRALALVGLGDTIPQASAKVEENLWRIGGNYSMRHDIGTEEALRKKTALI